MQLLLQAWALALAVPLALLVDRLWGEPPERWHPVVWMGRYLAWAGQWSSPPASSLPPAPSCPSGTHGMSLTSASTPTASMPPLRDLPALVRGMLAWWGGLLPVVAIALALTWLIAQCAPVLQVLLLALLLKPLLAFRMLHDEVQAVEQALGESLDAGRVRLARIVSRDTAALSASEVRESAIESLAENLNDSVLAALFWFVLLGLPGAAAYRFANTADAMWGYRGLRGGRDWEWAGKWAARADDVLSWLPARLTALALLVGAAVTGPALPVARVLRALPAEAGRTPSPNGGWPMAAMALVLGVRLAKPGVYALHGAAPPPGPVQMAQALALARRVVILVGVLGVVAGVAVAVAVS